MKYQLKAEYNGGRKMDGEVARIRDLSDTVVEVMSVKAVLETCHFLNLNKRNLTAKFKRLKVGEKITYISVSHPFRVAEVRNSGRELIHHNKDFCDLV